MRPRKAGLISSFLLASILAASAAAQTPAPAVDEFGTQDGNDLWIPAAQFVGVAQAFTQLGQWVCCAGAAGYYSNYSNPNDVTYQAPVLLPQGAYLDSWRAFYYDNSASSDFDITLLKNFDDITASPLPQSVVIHEFTSSGTPGLGNHHQVEGFTVDLREPFNGGITRNQAADFYVFEVTMPPNSNVGFKGVRVFWHRQVSPAPATATFGDVPTSDTAFQYIEALAASGITAGCGGGNYCPDAGLTRRQMAVFLSKALGLHWPALAQ